LDAVLAQVLVYARVANLKLSLRPAQRATFLIKIKTLAFRNVLSQTMRIPQQATANLVIRPVILVQVL